MIDSHCHLAGAEFEADLAEVVDRARAAGVTGALVILAADDEAELARWRRVHALWPETRAAVGIHPHRAGHYADDPPAAAACSSGASPSCRACVPSARSASTTTTTSRRGRRSRPCSAPSSGGRAHGLPVVIHTREAEADTIGILGETGRVDTTGVFHCFSGDAAAATRALATGYAVSIPGIVSFPKAADLRAAVIGVPADRLLVETDSPYLAPTPFRGRRNEPAYVARVVEVVAEARGERAADVAERTTANFRRLFRP